LHVHALSSASDPEPEHLLISLPPSPPPPQVVHQLKGERSYHIFYQLVRGANQEERKRYCLPTSPSYFNYLKQSGCMEIEGVDDASDLRAVQSALCDVGVDPLEQQQIFSLLSGGWRAVGTGAAAGGMCTAAEAKAKAADRAAQPW
jgi:hypothetical protein